MANPPDFLTDLAWSHTAALLPPPSHHVELVARKDYTTFGAEHIEAGAVHQMETAMKLPVTVAGALMPAAHFGYGLPSGGVLATDNAVIPYAVGVDIGCRMALSVFDLPAKYLTQRVQELRKVLLDNTRFGSGRGWERGQRLSHDVLDRDEFGVGASLSSASHGAGRLMSRTRAKAEIGEAAVRRTLAAHGVELIGGGLDEAPMAYKDIRQVMASQHELVDVLGTFTPKIVRMYGA